MIHRSLLCGVQFPLKVDLPYVPVWPGQSRNFGSCPGQLSESPGFSWSQLVTNYGTTLVTNPIVEVKVDIQNYKETLG